MTRHASAAASENLIGRTLGDFIIEEKIGEGGFGVVYRATQPALEREAVIKVLRADRVSPAAKERFLREARLASRIDHPHAAHVYAFGAEDDGLLWIAMELVRGISLDELLARQGPMPIERLGPLLEDVCAVVHAAHELGIVHRDIKPANVMVTSRAGRLVPKLLDLGIARLSLGANPAEAVASDQTLESVAADGISQDALVVGSPTYMAPEQWVDAATAGPPADIYALGILTYEALTGRPPFRGKNLLTLARAHARKPPPSLELGLPPELDQVLARALAKDPTERYANAVDFGASLCRAVGLHVRRAQIPKLPDPLRSAILDRAPQPVAECVALLDVAASAHEARDGIWSVLEVCAHYTGVLALASRTRTGAPDGGDVTEVTNELRALRAHGLSPGGWWALARGLCRPLQRYRAAAPIPDLVDVFFGADGNAGAGDVRWAAAWARRTDAVLAHAAEAELLAELPELLASLAAALESLLPVFEYRLAVPSGEGANVWQGVRHARQPRIAVRARALVGDRPILVDAQDLPVLVLWPLLQVAPPAPGAAAEVFMLAGPDRRRARLLAYPQSFSRADPTLWDWLAGTLRGLEGAGETGEVDEERPPYRGLATFSASDADGFFGREREVDAFLNRLKVEPFIAVVGPSGAGKSSFVHAGVVPGLGSEWRVISTRPGAHPLRALGVALSREGVELGNLAARLHEDPGALVEPVRVAAETTSCRFLIFVDQFEELFTLTHDPQVRELYVRALLAIAAEADAPVRLVFTLRDDFLIRAQSIEPLRDRLGHALQLLTQPLRNDLLRILTEPARRAGYEFEDAELPEEMVDAVADEPGGLALLSFTASKLWSKRDRHFRQLSRAGYEAIGGVGGALAMHAEATLEEMYPDQRRLVKEAFRHLITAEGTRAVIGRGDLVHVLGGAARAEETVERLVRARLLVASESDSGEDQVEVIHEALLRGWPRLETWRRDDREGARMRDLLREAASTWRERGRSRGLLWRGDALAEYRLWRKSFDGLLTPGEDAFAEASIAEEARARWRNRVILSAVIGILAIGVVLLAWSNQRTRKEERRATSAAREAVDRAIELRVEQGRQAYSRGEPLLALVYLFDAYEQGATGDGLRHLLAAASRAVTAQERSFEVSQGRVERATLREDGLLFAQAIRGPLRAWRADSGTLVRELSQPGVDFDVDDESGRVVRAAQSVDSSLVDFRTGATLFTFPDSAAVVARFSPDGRLAALAQANGTVQVWEVGERRLLHSLIDGDQTNIRGLAFSGDGSRLLVDKRRAVLWDVQRGALIATVGDPGRFRASALSADGRWLVTGATGAPSATIWNAVSGTLAHQLRGHNGGVFSVAFSPSGTRVATGGQDHARIWDAETGRLLAVLDGHDGPVVSIGFSPDGTRVVTGGADGLAAIYDASSGWRTHQFRGHIAGVFVVQFDGTGHRVMTGSGDGTVKLWRATPPATSGLPTDLIVTGFGARAGSLALSTSDGLAELWSTGNRERVARFAEQRLPQVVPPVNWAHYRIVGDVSPDGAAVAYPSGNRVFVYGADGTIRAALAGHEDVVNSARFSPDGTSIVSTANDGTARVWDVASARLKCSVRVPIAPSWFAEIDPSGATFAVGSLSGQVTRWDAATCAERGLIGSHGFGVLGVDFSSDGALVASAGVDQAVRIWRAGEAGAEPVTLLEGTHPFVAVSLSPSGGRVAAIGVDGTLWIWATGTGALLEKLQTSGGEGYWVQFLDETTLLSSSGALHVWELPLETRAPATFRAEVMDLIPYRLQGTRVITR